MPSLLPFAVLRVTPWLGFPDQRRFGVVFGALGFACFFLLRVNIVLPLDFKG